MRAAAWSVALRRPVAPSALASSAPARWKQSQSARIGIFKPTTLKMHDLQPRRTKPEPTGVIPVVAREGPAVASHWPSGVTAPTEGGEARADRFAAVPLGGKQYKVTPGDVLLVDRIKGAEVGTSLTIEDVLLVGSPTRTVIGRPTVPGATVTLAVEQQTFAGKDVTFKKRRRKTYQKLMTSRRAITVLRVEAIDFDLESVAAPELAKPATAAAASARA